MNILNYINGKLVAPVNDNYLNNIEPATGAVYSQVANSDQNDLEYAIKSASLAQPQWAEMPYEKKFSILNRLADLIGENAEKLARAEAIDNGKPITLARQIDIPRASANIRFFAQAMTQFSSECHNTDHNSINYTLRQPLGIVACISPWNLPLYLLTWKIAPALAAGNAVIAKPSEITPMTAYLFSELCITAGLPDGVLNILHGSGQSIGDPLVKHPKINAISFTGGTLTGSHIQQATAGSFKKTSLELGGKNPTLIFADCDLQTTVNETVRSAFANQGQICLCGSRIYVERSIYKDYLGAFKKAVKSLKIGDPLHDDTQFGAIVSKAHLEKIMGYIETAKKQGGHIETGGKHFKIAGRCQNGFFIEPTVITNLDNNNCLNQEEIFGPVCTIQPFDNDQQALDFANDSQYGLACSIWSQNINRCHQLARDINCGIIWINCWLKRDLRTPFGGMKSSGLGREGGLEAMRFFTECKNVCINYNQA